MRGGYPGRSMGYVEALRFVSDRGRLLHAGCAKVRCGAERGLPTVKSPNGGSKKIMGDIIIHALPHNTTYQPINQPGRGTSSKRTANREKRERKHQHVTVVTTRTHDQTGG